MPHAECDGPARYHTVAGLTAAVAAVWLNTATAAPDAAPDLDPTVLFESARGHVLQLVGGAASEAPSVSASAIALGDGIAVTQCDVLAAAVPGWRVIQRQRSYTAYPRGRDPSRNLCRLDVPGLRAPRPASVAAGALRVGQRVYAVGNALGLGLSLSDGLVSGLREANGHTWVQTTAALAAGSQGGALFDSAGRLVGMTDYARRDGQNVNFAAPADWLFAVPSTDSEPDADARAGIDARRLFDGGDWDGLARHAQAWTARRPAAHDAWLWLGIARERQQRLDDALAAYTRAHDIEPASLPAALARVRIELAQRQTEAAARTLAGLQANHPGEPDVWLQTAFAAYQRQQPAAAADALREATRLAPDRADAWQARGALANAMQDWDTAQLAAERLTRLLPESTLAWLALVDAQLQRQRAARALRTLDRAPAALHAHADLQFALGRVRLALGQPVAAIAAFKTALAASPAPSFPADVWRQLGQAYYAQELFPGAIAAYRQAARLAPGNVDIEADLGIALKDGGFDEEALALFVARQKRLPDDPLAARQIGYVNAKLGRLDAARTALERSLALDAAQPKVWHALGEVDVHLGLKDEARRVYRQLRRDHAERAETFYRQFLLADDALAALDGSPQ